MHKFVISKIFRTKEREIELEFSAIVDWRKWGVSFDAILHSLPTVDMMRYALLGVTLGPFSVRFYIDTYNLDY